MKLFRCQTVLPDDLFFRSLLYPEYTASLPVFLKIYGQSMHF